MMLVGAAETTFAVTKGGGANQGLKSSFSLLDILFDVLDNPQCLTNSLGQKTPFRSEKNFFGTRSFDS